MALVLALLLPLGAWATTYHTITIDGTNDFVADETVSGTSGSTWYFTWDSTHFYFGVNATDVGGGSDTKWVHLYLDTDPQATPLSGNGTSTGVLYNTQQPALPFNADFHFRWKADNSYTNMLDWNSSTSSWTDDNTGANNFGITAYQSGAYVEFSIPRTSLGDPDALYVAGAMINESGGGEYTFFMAPNTNTEGYDANYTHYFGFVLGTGVAPYHVDNVDCHPALTVTSNADSGADSLRQALADVCVGGSVNFNLSYPTTITLTSDQLFVNKGLTLTGPGADQLAISGNHARRILMVNSGRVTISGITFRDGDASSSGSSGGGIYNVYGDLTLQEVVVTHNRAGGKSSTSSNGGQATGGGIYNSGTLTITHSTISNNTAQGGSTSAEGYSGGTGRGGGIYSHNALILINSTLSGNLALGGEATGTTGTGGWGEGGGLMRGNGDVTLSNATISNNTATGGSGATANGNGDGGGIYALTSVTLSACTLTANSATNQGGGLYGYVVTGNGPSIQNTLIGGNEAPTGPDIRYYIQSLGYNLIEDTSDGTLEGDLTGNRSGDPHLGPLADNGGKTQTHALLAGSPAIDAIPAVSCTVATDQRGVTRPQLAGGACDIGAYEVDTPLLALTKSVTPETHVLYQGAITYTLVLSNAGPISDTAVILTDTLPGNVTFGAWVERPAGGLVRNGNAITWTGTLTAHTPVTFTFTADHGYGLDLITNTAYFSGTVQRGRAAAPFSVTCPAALVVTSNADSGAGSLRQAIADACVGGSITFNGDTSIILESELSLNKRLTVDGGSHAVTVSGNDAVRVFNIGASGVVTLSHLSIVSGTAGFGSGGGIYNEGQLRVYDSTIADNAATFMTNSGGGIYNSGTLTMRNSTLANNSANTGGGLYNTGGTVTVEASTLSSNTALRYGGGLYTTGGTVTVDASTLAHNQVTQSNYCGGGNGGGGLYNAGGNLTVQNSTLADNAASTNCGGGLYNAGRATVRASTLSGNAADYGGGIWNESGYLELQQTIVANSSSGHDCHCGVNGTNVTSLDGLFEATQENACGVSGDYNTVFGVDPLLGPLGDYGGPTPTFALLPNSPAIDAVKLGSCLPADQRGEPRTDLQCDIGAFELQHADSDTVVKSGMTTGAQASFGPTFISVTVTGGDAGTITATKHLTTPGGVYNTGELTATWWLTASNSPFTVTLSLCYTPDDIAGLSEDDLRAFRWNGSAWEECGGAVAGGCVTVADVAEFSAWTLFDTGGTAEKPTAARVVRLAAWGFAPVAALLALGGAAALRRRRR